MPALPLAPDQAFVDSFTNRGVTFFGWGNTKVVFDKKGNALYSTNRATAVQKTPNGAFSKTPYCGQYFGPYAACFQKTRTFKQDGVAVLPGDSGGPWVGWSNGWKLLAVERGGFSETCATCKGVEGGANVGAPTVRNWINSAIALRVPDNCPNGDYSGNAYDGTCGTAPPQPDYCPGGDFSGNAYDGTCGTPPPPPAGPVIHLYQGGGAPAGSWYNVVLTGFAPGTQVTLTCRDSVDPGGFWTQAFSIDGAGNASDSTLCYSGDHPDHWVTGAGYESNHVTW